MTIDRRSIPARARIFMSHAQDGWPLRAYAQPAVGAARGSILWLGGRGDIFEKYIEVLDGWSLSGWDVVSFDWRGQGGSGRVGTDPGIGHIDDFSVWIDDLAHFWGDWVARSPAPHVVIGHSMGGHLVLRAMTEKRIAPDKAVLVAPMLGFDTGWLPATVAAGVARLLGQFSSEMRPAWKHNERPSRADASRQAYLTHDVARYADERWWKEKDPSLALGPPSWRWLAAAYRSIMQLDRKGAVEQLRVPILILCADADRLVSPKAIRRYAARLPDARLIAFGNDVAHEILRECDGPRGAALAAVEAFLA